MSTVAAKLAPGMNESGTQLPFQGVTPSHGPAEHPMPNLSNHLDVERFRSDHRFCSVDAKFTSDNKDTVVLRCPMHAQLIVASIPYRMFCLDPLKCAGRTSCPRGYSCCE